MTAATSELSVIPRGAMLGAEIAGIDLSTDLSDEAFKLLEDAFHRYSVIFFRKQEISPENHIAFTRRFGEIEYHAYKQYTLPGYPEIFIISNIIQNDRPIGVSDAGLFWHTDMAYLAKPSRGSLLYAKEVPQKDGRNLGDTKFVSTAAAYDALPETTKRRIERLKAVHSYSGRLQKTLKKGPELGLNSRDNLTQEQKDKWPDVIHPVVRTHPVTGRKCIYVSEGECIGIVGMPQNEALALIDELAQHCIRPEFMYTHNWRAGDLLMWDNCSTQHLAVHDYKLPLRRLMHRITLVGSTPF